MVTINYYDDENRIIEDFQLHFEDWMSFPNLPEPGDIIIESIADVEQWKDWINSSGKDAPPPDFYNDKLQLMMDVMRVDDHTFIGKKGKPVNPTNARESQIQKKLHELGIFQIFPNAKAIQVNAITDLPTYEDHNYEFYLSNFKRIVQNHIDSIELYKKNHPGYKTIFFIMDESSGYVQVTDKSLVKRGLKQGESFQALPYGHFYDQNFVDVFRNSAVDYVIWFSPYKVICATSPFNLPSVCFYDVQKLDGEDFVDYPSEYIMSQEA